MKGLKHQDICKATSFAQPLGPTCGMRSLLVLLSQAISYLNILNINQKLRFKPSLTRNKTEQSSYVSHKSFMLCVSFLSCLILPLVALSQTPENEKEKLKAETVIIQSKTVEMNNKLKIITFVGDVNAKRNDFVIDCDKMIVYYNSDPAVPGDDAKTKQGDDGKTKIDKIVATGHVIITRTEGGKATAEKATYYQKDAKMVLTGNPMLTQKGDLVKGDRITIFIDKDRSIVESTDNKKDSKVTVIIAPRPPKEVRGKGNDD